MRFGQLRVSNLETVFENLFLPAGMPVTSLVQGSDQTVSASIGAEFKKYLINF